MRPKKTDSPIPPAAKALLEIEDGTFELVYDFNAIAEAEPQAGCNLLHAVGAALLHNMTASQMRGLLYALLRARHADMDLPRVGALIRLENYARIREALKTAIMATAPPEVAEKFRSAEEELTR
jgi:hypothetical protein